MPKFCAVLRGQNKWLLSNFEICNLRQFGVSGERLVKAKAYRVNT